MRNPNNTAVWRWFAVASLVVAFVWGAWQLAQAPLGSGEVYPAYSSLRADPLGTKALYESLQALPELAVQRLYREPKTLDANNVLFEFGVDATRWDLTPLDQLAAYEKLLDHGGRLILAFLPFNSQNNRVLAGGASEPAQRWDIRLIFREASKTDEVEPGLPRNTAVSLDLGPAWHSLKRSDDGPVAAERPLRKGTLVIVADSFPLSNEGLRDGRDVQLLAGILGDGHRVFFDENALGVSETGSVAGLIRKYRLQGTAGVLLIAAILFIWRNASGFLPPAESSGRKHLAAAIVIGRDTQAGMAALLRRTASEKQLMAACYAEWERSAARDAAAGQAERLKAEIQRHPASPVEAYRAACSALTKKRT